MPAVVPAFFRGPVLWHCLGASCDGLPTPQIRLSRRISASPAPQGRKKLAQGASPGPPEIPPSPLGRKSFGESRRSTAQAPRTSPRIPANRRNAAPRLRLSSPPSPPEHMSRRSGLSSRPLLPAPEASVVQQAAAPDAAPRTSCAVWSAETETPQWVGAVREGVLKTCNWGGSARLPPQGENLLTSFSWCWRARSDSCNWCRWIRPIAPTFLSTIARSCRPEPASNRSGKLQSFREAP
jgi:hypothetical protein